MMKMTRDLLNDAKAIMTDAQNLKNIGAFADSMGRSQSFHKYFDDNYTYDMEHIEPFGDFFTEEQAVIYKDYTKAVAEELFKLNHPELSDAIAKITDACTKPNH